MATFIGEEVAVRIDRPPGPVSAFTWRGAEYVVTKVEAARTRLDKQRSWWRRRHRDEYTVQTASGETFVLHAYHEARKRHWVLYEKVEKQQSEGSKSAD